MKTKKAIKYIIKHPELFSYEEIQYVKMIRRERKLQKKLRKEYDKG